MSTAPVFFVIFPSECPRSSLLPARWATRGMPGVACGGPPDGHRRPRATYPPGQGAALLLNQTKVLSETPRLRVRGSAGFS